MSYTKELVRIARMKQLSVEALLLLIITVPALGQQQLPTRHVREEVMNGEAQKVAQLPGGFRMNLAIVLPLRNEAQLDDFLQELYDPASPSYGQYLSVAQFTESFGPAEEQYDAVINFAIANGMAVTSLAPNRMVVEVSSSVKNIERAFHLTLGIYQDPSGNRTFYAPDREPAPDLNVPLWHIAGLDNFSLPQPASGPGVPVGGAAGSGSGPGGSFIGSDMRSVYYGGTSLTGSGQAVGLVEFSAYNLSDVQAYFKNVGQTLRAPISNVLLGGFNGVCGSCNDSEAALDIQQAISMAPGLSELLVYEVSPSSVGNGGDVSIFNRMATDDIAKQLSCSWLWYPDDPSSDDPIFKEFAAQGQSLFAASGDWSSYPFSITNCPNGCYFPPEDPNVTAVGGTVLTTTGPGGTWESETGWVYSGGGISPDHLAIPSYQQLSGVINSSNQGSTTYRNVPDIAAQADYVNYICYSGSCATNWGGTSFAAPRWAGFLALINQNNKTRGKSYAGFINPTIYPIGVGSGYANYFHDITSGNTDSGCCHNTVWYSAVKGYDLVTGWGSPEANGWLGGPGLINTVAGDGTGGYSGDGGLATGAELYYPFGVTTDGAGNLYIADNINARIRKVTASSGFISTVAGDGGVGYSGDGGLATNAELDEPLGVAVDGAGNVYIADVANNRIRKVTASTGIISTVAGNGTAGYSGDGGAATGAELHFPYDVAVDSAGNVYIADSDNSRIRKVTISTGIISTVAGDGTPGYSGDGGLATSAELNFPTGVILDSAGNIYIGDFSNSRIRKVTISTGKISTVAGNGTSGYSGDGGPATSAELCEPGDLAVDSAGDIYIADYCNNRIRKVTASSGDISTVAGDGTEGYSGDGGAATSAELNLPAGVALANGGHILYIGDQANQRIRAVGQ